VKEIQIEQFIANPPWSGFIFGTKSEVEWIRFFDKMLFEFEKIILK